MVAEKDTALSPLSRIPRESRRNSLFLTRLAQPSLPTAASAACSARIPKQKGSCCSGSRGEAAMPGLWRRGREGSPAAAVQRRGSPEPGLRLENPPCASAPSIATKQQGAFPGSLPCSRDLLLTLMARQEPAPCSQLILSSGNAGSQPRRFAGLVGKAPAASLLQIQPVPPPRPLPEAAGFHSLGGSK